MSNPTGQNKAYPDAIRTSITLTAAQWRLVEQCMASTIGQINDHLYGLSIKYPHHLEANERELCRVRFQISHGIYQQGIGITESLKQLDEQLKV